MIILCKYKGSTTESFLYNLLCWLEGREPRKQEIFVDTATITKQEMRW